MNNLSVRSLQGLLLLFLDKHNDFSNKNEEFYNSSIDKVLMTINGMPNQLYAGGLQVRDIYPELKKYFYKENSDVTWEEFLTTKFALWIDTRSSTDNTPEVSAGDLMCYMFSLEDALVHLSVINPSGIFTIEK